MAVDKEVTGEQSPGVGRGAQIKQYIREMQGAKKALRRERRQAVRLPEQNASRDVFAPGVGKERQQILAWNSVIRLHSGAQQAHTAWLSQQRHDCQHIFHIGLFQQTASGIDRQAGTRQRFNDRAGMFARPAENHLITIGDAARVALLNGGDQPGQFAVIVGRGCQGDNRLRWRRAHRLLAG